MNFNSILALTYAFTLSFVPLHHVGTGVKENTETYYNATYVNYELGLEALDMFAIYTGESTRQTPGRTIFTWQPYNQTYYLGAEVHKEFNQGLFVALGIKHLCSHPVNCWRNQPSGYNEAYTEVYIGVNGKLDLIKR